MSIKNIILRIALIILLVEATIMVMLNLFAAELGSVFETIIDSFFLVVFSTPIIYLWVIKPFIMMRNRAMDQAAYLAYNDALTGLANRTQFLDWLGHSLLTRSNNKDSALILLDINRFKVINDTYGHTAADYVLVQIADKLKRTIKDADILARIGPDQFALLVENIKSDDEIYLLAKKILAAVKTPINYENNNFTIDGSIGISICPKDALDKESLLKYANTAIRQAKILEDEKISFYTSALTEMVQQRLTLEEDMRSALENREFFLLYQPKIDANTDRLIGVEALIRWKHPKKGLISPVDFIPLAEDTGLIVPIGMWVLQEAIKQLQIWIDEGKKPIVMSINLSGRQLNLEQVEYIISALRVTQIPMEYIEFEITETYLMKDVLQSQLLLEKLHNSGISLSMDDFGTGYSSLGYLKRFKVDTLKIDKILIRDIENDKNDFAIAKAIVAMGHTLEMKVIAEGVETQAQVNMLREIGCDYFQGYYFSKPKEAEEIYLGNSYKY